MRNFSKDDEIELSRILESIQGKIDKNLSKLIMDFIFSTNTNPRKEDLRLFSINSNKIPDESLDAFSLGSFFGQAYQISLDFAKKMNLKLDVNQKRLLREYVFFLVLFKFENETRKK